MTGRTGGLSISGLPSYLRSTASSSTGVGGLGVEPRLVAGEESGSGAVAGGSLSRSIRTGQSMGFWHLCIDLVLMELDLAA